MGVATGGEMSARVPVAGEAVDCLAAGVRGLVAVGTQTGRAVVVASDQLGMALCTHDGWSDAFRVAGVAAVGGKGGPGKVYDDGVGGPRVVDVALVQGPGNVLVGVCTEAGEVVVWSLGGWSHGVAT